MNTTTTAGVPISPEVVQRVSDMLRRVFRLRKPVKLDFRWAQLEADARAFRDGRPVALRTPLVDTSAPELTPWREALVEVDERVETFVVLTKESCGFCWERCDDLSRHLLVWADGKEHALSIEPRQDGLIDMIASTLHQSSCFMPGGPKSVLVATGLTPAQLCYQLDLTVRRWSGLLPSQAWWLGMCLAACDVVAAYGFRSRAGAAAVAVVSAMEGNPFACMSDPFAPFTTSEEHVRLAALLKIAVEFTLALPPENPLRAAIWELFAALREVFDTDNGNMPNPYRSSLV